jgi:hypothetical protein
MRGAKKIITHYFFRHDAMRDVAKKCRMQHMWRYRSVACDR